MIITGNEPKHWHDENGRHRMTDPRTIDGWNPKFWDADERAYVAHLIECENPTVEPEDDDPEEIKTLFALIASREQEISVTRQLIHALRMRNLQEPGNQED